MKHALTKRQTEALTFIRMFIKEKQYSPTIQEIADALGYANRGAAAGLIEKLEMRGHISRVPGATRSISIVTDEREELAKLRNVRDAAGVFIYEQENFRPVYEADQNSQEAREAGGRVADALQRLKVTMEAGS
tara:strand:- start:2259 stop:2657 length:399 start_codon:yes stop_codon:yes gene_type:complete